MNIVIFTRSLPMHASSGGMETQTHLLAEGLVKAGHQVSVITNPHALSGEKAEQVSPYRIFFTEKGNHTKYTRGYFQESAEILSKIHQEKKVDVVISESAAAFGYSTSLKATLGIPVVLIQHGTIWGEVNTLRRSVSNMKDFLRLILRICPYALKNYFLLDTRHFRLVDHFIAVSAKVKQALMDEYFIPQNKVTVVYNGIDVTKFEIPSFATSFAKASEVEKATEGRQNLKFKLDMRTKFGFTPNDLVLLYVGRVIREKGLEDVIEVLPKLPENVKFMVVGEGPYQDKLKVISQKSNVVARVKFAGKVDYDEVMNYYNIADIFVFPTHREEGFPMTLVEAQACGLPVIVADKGGCVEAIEEGKTGLAYESGNTDQLFQKIFELLSSPPLRLEMSHNARKRTESLFSQERMVTETVKVLQGVTGTPPSTTGL